MKQVVIQTLKKGDYFKLSNTESAPVWCKDKYCRSSKGWQCNKFEDVNHWGTFKKGRKVWIDFDF